MILDNSNCNVKRKKEENNDCGNLFLENEQNL